MDSRIKLYEKKLFNIWKNQSFKSNLKTNSGEDISVIDAGVFNEDSAGPDFLNARVRIGNLLYVGDIEIDCEYSYWKTHGHNIDSKHNKVILHVCYSNNQNQQYVYTKDGRRIPTVSLSKFVSTDEIPEIDNAFAIPDEKNKFKCSHVIDKVDYDLKKKFISELGMERFDKKCKRAYDRLKELSFLNKLKINEPVIRYELRPGFENQKFTHEDFTDKNLWAQLFYEMVFEALGYTKNKSAMLKLAQSANIDFILRLGDDADTLSRLESALFNISGLAPDVQKLPAEKVSEYTKKIAAEWTTIKRLYDGQMLSETDWHFLQLRPLNFPTIRIAGGARLLYSIVYQNLIGVMIKKLSEIRSINVLLNSLKSLLITKSSGFWKSHYVFDKPAKDEIKYFVGASRVDEIIVNVVLPFLFVYFDIFGKKDLSKKVLQCYNIFNQSSGNQVVKDVADALNTQDFLKKTLLTQGMLELFRNYCSKKRCLECEIGKAAFN